MSINNPRMRAVSSNKNNKGSQPAVLEGKMIPQRRSSRSLSKLSNNSVDLTEGSSRERRGGVLIVLKDTGCGARSFRICEGASE